MNKNDVVKMKPSAYKSMLLKKFKLNKEQPIKRIILAYYMSPPV